MANASASGSQAVTTSCLDLFAAQFDGSTALEEEGQ
jgi:hypothetical protein